MSTPLLTTKLFIPTVNAELVERPRLVAQLNAGLGRKLTLISAPAGFGKTTLLTEWIQTMGKVDPPIAIAWVSLDERDNDPVRFLTYVIAALQTMHLHVADAEFGRQALTLLRAPQTPPSESILTAVINDITAASQAEHLAHVRIVLVLDDYHLIEERRVHQDLTFLLHHMPPAMHVIIASRSDPPLHLPRLRVQGQLTEIRARDLRFTASEAATFLNQMMGLDLSDDQVALLDQRTEGWIAGLQLAAHSMQLQNDKRAFLTAFAGDDRYIADYLMEEVFNHQPAHVQEFLLQTSILDQLTPSLCNAVLERTDSRAVIDSLEQSNLFIIPLDNKREWYRYHRLFADLLRERLEESARDRTVLHHRASQWYRKNGHIPQAVEHSLAVDAYADAMGLIEEGAPDLFLRSELTTLTKWWRILPQDMVSTRPRLCMIYAWAWLATGNPEKAKDCLTTIERAINVPMTALTADETKDSSVAPEIRAALIEIAVVRSTILLEQFEVPEALHLAQLVLPYLEQEGQPRLFNTPQSLRPVMLFNVGLARRYYGQLEHANQALVRAVELGQEQKNLHLVGPASACLAGNQATQGRLAQAAKTCKQAVQWLETLTGPASPMSGQLLIIWSSLLYEWNRLESAQRMLDKGLELAKMWNHAEALLPGYLTLARLRRAQGDWQSAYDSLETLTELVQSTPQAAAAARAADDFQAILQAELGDSTGAQRQVRARRLGVDADVPYFREEQGIIQARLLLASGAPDEALEPIAELRASAEAGGRWGRVIELLVLQATALDAADQPGDALKALTHALRLAEPEGFVRTFVDAGPTIAHLLLKAIETDIAADYCRRLLGAFPDAPARAPISVSTPGGDASPQIEPLTPRELQVLQLIAEGLSNTLIAERLFLAPGTVKVHAHNIYSKLGVGNRTQAVARARSLGILSHLDTS